MKDDEEKKKQIELKDEESKKGRKDKGIRGKRVRVGWNRG